jgi:hypothetical protein
MKIRMAKGAVGRIDNMKAILWIKIFKEPQNKLFYASICQSRPLWVRLKRLVNIVII